MLLFIAPGLRYWPIAVIAKDSNPNSRHGNQDFGQGFFRGWQTGRQKYFADPSTWPNDKHPFFYPDAKHRPAGASGGDIAGIENAKTGSITDTLTREHRMTLDEAQLILNLKRDDALEQVLKVCLVWMLV